MKIIQTTILLIASLFLLNSSFAQGWQKTIRDSTNEMKGRHVEMADNGDLLVYGHYDISQNTSHRAITRVSNDGETLWQKIYNFGITEAYWATNIAKTDGGYYMAGAPGNASNVGDTLIVVKIDEEGDIISTFEYAEPNISWFTFNATSDGGSIIAWNDGMGLVTVMKTNSLGVEEWRKQHNFQSLHPPIEANDSGYFITSNSSTLRLDENGDELWKRIFCRVEQEDATGDIICSGSQLYKLDSLGNTIWYTQKSRKAIIAPNGHIFSYGYDYNNPYNIVLDKFDADGNLLKTETLLTGYYNDQYDNRLVVTSDYHIACLITIYDQEDRFILLIKTDNVAVPFDNLLQGNIYEDLNKDCSLDPGDISNGNFSVVKVQGENTLRYCTPDSTGAYEMFLDTGSYEVSLIFPNSLWTACAPSVPVVITGQGTTSVDLLFKKKVECTHMEVDISTPLLRRCFNNQYYVNYCNKGTITAENSSVTVALDPKLSYLSSSIPLTSQTGNILEFDLGDVLPTECGDFSITTYLDCDSTLLGENHCVSAHITPAAPCYIDPAWSGANIELEAECTGDSLFYYINNTGTGDMQAPSNYVVTEDVIMRESGTFQLNSGETKKIAIPSNGSTFRLMVDQVPLHPYGGHPSLVVEGCVPSGQAFNLGYANMYAEDDGHPFFSMDCQENIGSYDPNDKRGFPSGFGAENYIEDYNDIEYHIRFQNTGTDTAFTVKIRDSLSTFLDPETVIPGASSHPYDFEIDGTGQLLFTFNDILLVDSFANEPDSHGFVKFRVAQKADNPIGTVINNRAGIYFDFNTPVITNTTTHTVGLPLIPQDDLEVNLFLYLEGAMTDLQNPGNYLSHMRADLNLLHGILPGQTPTNEIAATTVPGQPYNTSPWNYQGQEGLSWTDTEYDDLYIENGNAVVDWLLVSFRTDVGAASEIARSAAVVLQDGMLVFPRGSGLSVNTTGTVYVVIEHRNHLGIMSPQAILIEDGVLSFDFTKSDSYLGASGLGRGQKLNINGDYMMYATDSNQAADPLSYDINGLDKLNWESDNGNFSLYQAADFDMNGDVNGEDRILWVKNNGISSRVPK